METIEINRIEITTDLLGNHFYELKESVAFTTVNSSYSLLTFSAISLCKKMKVEDRRYIKPMEGRIDLQKYYSEVFIASANAPFKKDVVVRCSVCNHRRTKNANKNSSSLQ